MQIGSVKDFRIGDFVRKNRNCYTFKLKSAKELFVVEMDIESSLPIDEIGDVVATAGMEVNSVQIISGIGIRFLNQFLV